MRKIRVGSGSINTTPLDFSGNKSLIISLIDSARTNRVSILCLPELAICGYGCEDEFLNLATSQKSLESLQDILPHTRNMMIALGLPIYFEGSLYNCIAAIHDGSVVGINAKKFLPREGVHYEPRWFDAWQAGRVSEITILGEKVPLGDLIYQFGDTGIGIEICEEAWGPESGIEHNVGSCDIILNPSASHFSLGKFKLREQLVADASRSLRACYVYSNLRGLEAGRIIYDGSAMIGINGEIASRAQRFGFEPTSLTTYDLDLDQVRVNKLKSRSTKASATVQETNTKIKLGPLNIQKFDGTPLPQTISYPQSFETEFEEFQESVMVGLFDYMRKTRTKGYIISLSGGYDSTICAYLCAKMLVNSFEQLGGKSFQSLTGLSQVDQQELVAKNLTCVYQSTNFSTPTTYKAAEEVALSLGAKFHKIDIQDIVNEYTKIAEKFIGRSLTWEQDDLALQNIQARARAPGVWLLANIEGKILITTSNRSEAAVGYVTMDGDSAGGLAPIAGVDKDFLKNWLNWVYQNQNKGLKKLDSLALILSQVPSAELRPHPQSDEEDLMPYDVLAEIERLIIRDKMDKTDAAYVLKTSFPKYSNIEVSNWLDKFQKLWQQSQWKRERLAPSFHIDDFNVDPRSWCRFPIISGN